MERDIFKQVGKNIQNTLAAQGKSQQYLADRLGISKQVMSKIIAGAKAINVAEISRIAEILQVSADSLLSSAPKMQENGFSHHFSFMGQVKNEKTREKIEFLQSMIEEILMLEAYEDVE